MKTKRKKVNLIVGVFFMFSLLIAGCKDSMLDENIQNKVEVLSNQDFTVENGYLVFKTNEAFYYALNNIDNVEIISTLEKLSLKGFKSLNSLFKDILQNYQVLSDSKRNKTPIKKNDFNNETLKKYNDSFIIQDGNIYPNTFNLSAQKLVNKDRIVKIGKYFYQFDYDKAKIVESLGLVSVDKLSKTEKDNVLVDVQLIQHSVRDFTINVPKSNLSSKSNNSSRIASNAGQIEFGNIIDQGFMYMYFSSTVKCRVDNVFISVRDCELDPNDRGHGPPGSEYKCYDGYEDTRYTSVSMRHGVIHENIWGTNSFDSCPDGILEMKCEGSVNTRLGAMTVNFSSGSGNEFIERPIGVTNIVNNRKRLYQYSTETGDLTFTAKVKDITNSAGNYSKSISFSF